jgi:hypothetical protein
MAVMKRIYLVLAAVALAAPPVAENVYRGELLSYPGPWAFQLRRPSVILVTDEELETLAADPDKVLNLATGRAPRLESLRQICERAQAAGARTLIVAFDHFFRQYRPGQDRPRRLMPDMDESIARMASISRFAARYGLGLELSLLSPLEMGKTFAARTGESGLWMHYRKGLRDPRTGAFSVELWRHTQWVNNKGPVEVADAGVRVFAFRESPVAGTPYRVVDPAAIVEIKDSVRVERYEGLATRAGDFRAERVRVFGRGGPPDLDRVLVVQQYRTPEMDYFSPRALPFLTGVVDRYAAAGVKLNALYSDEMHIQGDWAYFNHHDHGEFAVRYVSPHLAREFAARYGAAYGDFAKYLVYFVHGQEDGASDLSAKQGVMHVFGASPADVRRTALFRARYYRLLQDGVVDLFVQAKRHAEQKAGYKLEARGHATWAQSPTIDFWDVGRQNRARQQYEYTSNFVWSNTVHQAATACHDYFKWGDFLTGNGNDHAEGGWLDRDYYALALACSTGILNEVPYSYAAHWGMPAEVSRRRTALVDTFGASGTPAFGAVQDLEHRDVDVLMLYPLDLVAVEERFGSWMTQYGYANYVTAAKLLERGRVEGGAIRMAGRRFTTLVAVFEPFPSKRLIEMMRDLVRAGGRVIWSGPPPVLTFEGEPALPLWQPLFGVRYQPGAAEGLMAPGREVRFAGALSAVLPQVILTDFLVDRVYGVEPQPETEVVARAGGLVVGTRRGGAVFLGFRPRDDQSGSLGYETRTWFETLHALGAYAGDGNTEVVSRTTPYLACRFPNGATALAPHLREYEEDWPGGFARDPEADRLVLERHPPPSDAIHLRGLAVNGHRVTYDGSGAVAFRLDARGELMAFAGYGARRITVDGRDTVFADGDMPLAAWAPVPAARCLPGGAVYQVFCRGTGTLRVPAGAMPERVTVFAEGPRPGSRGAPVTSRREAGALALDITPAASGRWLYVVPVP